MGIYFAALLAIKLASLWVLIFGSVVVAVILRSIADPLVRWARLPDGLAVLAAVLLIIVLIGGVSLIFGRHLGTQASNLAERLPAAWEFVLARVQASPLGDRLVDMAGALAGQAGRALILAQRLATSLLSGFTTLTLVLVAGVFLALRPASSREGVLVIFPLVRRHRLREVMDACGRALKAWLRAQLVSMATVGTLTGLGLWALGAPSAGALGLLTGLAQFVPIVGPILAALPALLVAATEGGQTLLLTLVLYIAVSQLEAT